MRLKNLTISNTRSNISRRRKVISDLERKTGFFGVGEGTETQADGDFEMRLLGSSVVLVLKLDELFAEARGFSSDGAGLALCHSLETTFPTGRGMWDVACGNRLMVIRPLEPFCNIKKASQERD